MTSWWTEGSETAVQSIHPSVHPRKGCCTSWLWMFCNSSVPLVWLCVRVPSLSVGKWLTYITVSNARRVHSPPIVLESFKTGVKCVDMSTNERSDRCVQVLDPCTQIFRQLHLWEQFQFKIKHVRKVDSFACCSSVWRPTEPGWAQNEEQINIFLYKRTQQWNSSS